ncbi:MAG: polysaccharide biosynthesis tyrosine autokinase [Lachnospiraceae bacterium]|nr:polysaccharide biosynthesis tyrosine autokinase [Lachnospiraceae bacterium]
MATVNLKKIDKDDFRMNEAFKSLRSNLEFCGDQVKVIALTSCTPNEGKSSVSLNLAISLAEAGKKVLYLDLDLRKSVLIGKLQTQGGKLKGMTHFLSGQNKLMEVINQTNIPNLQLAVAGPVPPNPAELLTGRHFKALIEAVRKVYDYIILDTPSLGSVIDSAIIAKECDGVAIVVEAGSVSYKFVQNVKEQLEKTGCPILGVILNKVEMAKNSYYGKYYGKYYGEYYGHQDKNETEGAE